MRELRNGICKNCGNPIHEAYHRFSDMPSYYEWEHNHNNHSLCDTKRAIPK